VALVEHLLRVGSFAASGHGPLIRKTSISFFVSQLNLEIGSLATRPSSRDWFKGAVQLLGLNPDEYRMHSGRRGKVMRAANVAVPDRLFKEHNF
jgi:hypothetical protein